MKNRFAWVALTAVSFALLTTIPLWWPRLRLHAVSQQLRNIKSDSEAMALVSELLQSDTDYGLSVVAGYASHSSLRALHRRHRIFLMHDASSGKIHYTLAAPEGTFEIPAALEISDQQRKDLERAATETIGRTTTITCFGDPPIVFSGIHVLEEAGPNRESEQVHFILKLKDRPEYRQIEFRFVSGRCAAIRHCGVSDASLQQWRLSSTWPELWK